MYPTVFTPKQVAQALGVSESSVKRWVDSGRLPAAKTAGGHRKVPLPSLMQFVRQTGHELVDPELVGMVATAPTATLEATCDRLFEGLIAGQEVCCREMLLSFYQRGESVTAIGDRLIGPIFQRIGEGWANGTVRVHEERRACEIVVAALHELRLRLPAPPTEAPLAVIVTPLQDFAEVPSRLVELVLATEGWRVIAAGSGLPLEEIHDAVVKNRPQLVCVSATHLEDPCDFINEYNRKLSRPLRGNPAGGSPRLVVGGSGFGGTDVTGLECDLFATTLAELSGFAR